MASRQTAWEIFTQTGSPDVYILHKSLEERGERKHVRNNGHRTGDKAVGIR